MPVLASQLLGAYASAGASANLHLAFASQPSLPSRKAPPTRSLAGSVVSPVKYRACRRNSLRSHGFRQPNQAYSRCRLSRPSVACDAASPRRQQIDLNMIWGDILMLTATNLASERLPKHLTGVLSLTLVAAWIGVAIAKGDYTMKQSRNFSFQYVYSIVLGMEQAAITWLLFVPTAMAMYACLVSHHLLDSGVFRVPPGARVSPEGEVMIAALFTLMSWRGIYSSQLF